MSFTVVSLPLDDARDASKAPASSGFDLREKVKVFWPNVEGDRLYRGEIVENEGNGKYSIRYYDENFPCSERVEASVKQDRIRPLSKQEMAAAESASAGTTGLFPGKRKHEEMCTCFDTCLNSACVQCSCHNCKMCLSENFCWCMTHTEYGCCCQVGTCCGTIALCGCCGEVFLTPRLPMPRKGDYYSFLPSRSSFM